MTPDLSYYWEGGREFCEDNKRDEGKQKQCSDRKNYGGCDIFKRLSESGVSAQQHYE